MSESAQRRLVRELFDAVAKDWTTLAYDPHDELLGYPLGKVRIDVVRRELQRGFGGRKLIVLDAGCGAGDAALALLAEGHSVFGVDLAPAMIGECRRKYAAQFPRRRDVDERFVVDDVESFRFGGGSFDLIYALGLLEYLESGGGFLRNAYEHLNPEGLLFVECRNRLFNVVSANAYTMAEADSGELASLIRAFSDVERYSPLPDSAIPEMLARVRWGWEVRPALSQPEARASEQIEYPGDMVRRQFTPAELDAVARQSGFALSHVVYYHMHPLPPRYEALFPQIYNALALAFQPLGETTIGGHLATVFLGVLRKASSNEH